MVRTEYLHYILLDFIPLVPESIISGPKHNTPPDCILEAVRSTVRWRQVIGNVVERKGTA